MAESDGGDFFNDMITAVGNVGRLWLALVLLATMAVVLVVGWYFVGVLPGGKYPIFFLLIPGVIAGGIVFTLLSLLVISLGRRFGGGD